MRRRLDATGALVAALLLPLAVARAEVPYWTRGVADLAERLRALEARFEDGSAGLPRWLTRFHVAGNGTFAYREGDRHSPAPNGDLAADDTRVFLDTDLAEDLHLGERPLVGYTSFYVEWEAVEGQTVQNRVGSLYLRLDGILGFDALNAKVGRVLLPYGEEYVRFAEQRAANPLLSFSAAAPYGRDQGILLFGGTPGRRVQYVAGVLAGDTGFAVDLGHQTQLAAKLIWEPRTWAHLSLSGLRTGPLGSGTEPGAATLELGETHVTPFGSATDVPSFQNGARIADDPTGELSMNAGEADLIVNATDWGRLWLAGGRVAIRSAGASAYDRDLTYGTAEAILGLGAFTRTLERLYVAARYSAIGTFDRDRGYLLDAMNGGEDLGFNTRRVTVASLGIGVRLTSFLTLKSEYSWYDFVLVRGVTPDIRADAGGRNFFGVGATVAF
ncbi:MAG TPA: hypothetical protein VEM57_10090 [Candidatus Binatus sp.]|nr:hypothetical protein [Candidatus Binatus sp.]